MTKTSELLHIPLTDVDVVEGRNPRGAVDRKSESFKAFVASVKDLGVLQPILVGPPNGNGKYTLIAGERRYLAATAAKLPEIPALIASHLSGDELRAAIVENVQREDLTPIEEAEAILRLQQDAGLTQPKVAKVLGRSERWVRDRLVLLKLPDPVRPAFGSGEIPLEAARVVEKIAKQSPVLAEALVDASSGEKAAFDGGDMLKDQGLPIIIDHVVEQGMAEGCFKLNGRSDPADLPLPKDQVKELSARLKKIGPIEASYGEYDETPALRFEDGDADLARTYGCLVEIPRTDRLNRKFRDFFVTDPEWLYDRALQKLDDLEKKAAKWAKKKAARQPKDGDQVPDDLSAEELAAHEEKVKQERRKEREQEDRKRAAAHDTNIALGHNLFKELGKPKITVEMARTVALMAIDGLDLAQYRLAAAGLVYVREDMHEVKEAANGAIKVEPMGCHEAHAQLIDEILKAKTPEAVIGLVMQAVISAAHADEVVAVQSRREAFSHGRSYTDASQRIATEIGKSANAVASALGVLPDKAAKAAAKKAREAAE